MGIIEIVLLSFGLGMDAFAVAVCKGIAMKKMDWKSAIIIGTYFGEFQAIMPLIGYALGNTFENLIIKIDHWIAFSLLGAIGIDMIINSRKKDEIQNDNIDVKHMTILAIATSIDALAVGITFSFLKVNVILAITLIGIITFILSVMGTKIGNRFGSKYGKIAQVLGGITLILLGTNILFEHLGIFH